MPYHQSLRSLENELQFNQNRLCILLRTNLNIYSFRSMLSQDEEQEMIDPIRNYLLDKDYVQYDAFERRTNTIYYITRDMVEFTSMNEILEFNNQIQNGELLIATLHTVLDEKIKLVIIKKGEFLFLYRYNTGKLFTQGWKALFNVEQAIVEKDNNSTLFLSKEIPDIILDLQSNVAFLMNITQAEYILEIESLFQNTLNIVSQNLVNFQLMREDTVGAFINQVGSKNNFLRKLNKIQTTQSYQYFQNNITRIPGVLRRYALNVNFDEINGHIIFDDETDVGDVLHLFADDYVQRYISERDDVIN